MSEATNMHGYTIDDMVNKIPFDTFWKYFDNNVADSRTKVVNDAVSSLFLQCEFSVNIWSSDKAVVTASLPDGSFNTEVSYYGFYDKNNLFDCTPYFIINKCRKQIQNELQVYLASKIDSYKGETEND